MTRRTPAIRHSHGSPLFTDWARLSRKEKLKEIVYYAADHCGLAITLNFSPAFEAKVSKNPDPVREISRRLNAELHKIDLQHTKMFLVLQVSPSGRLHLHGVAVTHDDCLDRLQRAMRRAVGFEPGHRGSRQFHAVHITEPDGWFEYIFRDKKLTRTLLSLADDKKFWWTSRAMTQATRDNYEALRTGKRAPANEQFPPQSNAL